METDKNEEDEKKKKKGKIADATALQSSSRLLSSLHLSNPVRPSSPLSPPSSHAPLSRPALPSTLLQPCGILGIARQTVTLPCLSPVSTKVRLHPGQRENDEAAGQGEA